MAKQSNSVHDNTKMPIIAFDFDGTLTVTDTYPAISELRPYAKEIIDFIRACGMRVVIWTCRDNKDGGIDTLVIDDVTPMENFLRENHITVDGINSTIEYAPWAYESRKVYASMYVDDRSYGWIESNLCLMYVLGDILTRFCGCDNSDVAAITSRITKGEDVSEYAAAIKRYLTEHWV